MRDLDDTDRAIIGLLLDDARRSWRDIADRVDLSPPAVSDRVDRLQDLGVVRGFTVDIDRSKLHEDIPVLVTVEAVPGRADGIADAVLDSDAVEHVLATADERVVFSAVVNEGAVRPLLREVVDFEDVREFDVSPLRTRAWNPTVDDAELGLTCDECGNTVTSEGESVRLDGDRYHFCCESCLDSFVEMFENLRDGAEV